MGAMSLDDYKVVLYKNQPSGWVAEVPAIPGCHALMPTQEAALIELAAVFQMISTEYAARNQVLPADTTEIIHASWASMWTCSPACGRYSPSRKFIQVGARVL